MVYSSRKQKNRIVLMLTLSLVMGLTPPAVPREALADVTVVSEPGLNKTKTSVTVGATRKLTMENYDKKVTWSVDSTKYLKIRSYTDTTVTLEGVKKGTAVVTGKVDKKSYTCKVTVKEAAATAKPTATTKAKATATPKATAKATTKPKATATPKATAKVVALSKTKVSMYVGKTKKITMNNTTKKVKWSLDTTGKKYASIKKTTDTTVKLAGVKKGKATLTGVIGKKVYTCAVTVKLSTPVPTAKPKATATPKATTKPKATATPKATTKPKATATPKATTKPKATATPKTTATPKATATTKPKTTATPKESQTPTYTVAPIPSFEPDAVTIGHASINEKGTARGGVAGDQTGKEVCIREWYNKGWNKMVRCKDEQVANKIARAMENACANNNIGYCQDKRNTSFTQAAKVNWVIKNIATPCDADCSSLVRVCVNAGYYKFDKFLPFPDVGDTFYTGNMAMMLEKTGLFEIHGEAKYLKTNSYLKRGDILIAEGSHTVIVLKDSPLVD